VRGKAAVHLSLTVTAKKPSNLGTRLEKKKNFFFKAQLSLEKVLWISQEHALEHSSLPTSSTTGK